jgi:hypothetical protein
VFFSNTSVDIIKIAGERTLKKANFGLDWQRNLAGTRKESEREHTHRAADSSGWPESVESHNKHTCYIDNRDTGTCIPRGASGI